MTTSIRDMYDAGTIDQDEAIRYLLLDRQTVTEYTNTWGRPSGAMYADLAVIDRDLTVIAGQAVDADAMQTAAVARQDYSIIPAPEESK